jgi:hypothetical protein
VYTTTDVARVMKTTHQNELASKLLEEEPRRLKRF